MYIKINISQKPIYHLQDRFKFKNIIMVDNINELS